ncbi:MAG: acylphosphatase [Pseudomonadota bacterium]
MTIPSTHQCRRMRVTGRVQRVAFRAHTAREALRLGLVGSATNQTDGSVVVIAQGLPTQLDALVAWLHKGPALARVEAVECDTIEVDPTLDGFARR